MLTEALNRLLGTGLIERRYRAEASPRVDYALTSLGRSFADGPMRALATWVTDHGDELFEAQELHLSTEAQNLDDVRRLPTTTGPDRGHG
nr:winged helix-turn-helix transcriptional regulator [Cryptosporangium arvum]